MNNLTLAETHSSNRKLVAFCVAKASLLALIVNGCVIPAGMVSVVLMMHLAWYANILPIAILIPVGVLLAIVVDGMTMGSCARLRKTFEKCIEIKNHYASKVKEEKEPEIEAQEKHELDALKPSYIINGSFIGIFTIISVGAGEIFWHSVLSGLPDWLAWCLSSLFSIAVSSCLIASELLKNQNEEVIQESIDSVKFHKKAFLADSEEDAMKHLHNKFDGKVKELSEAEIMTKIVEEKAIGIYNDILFDGEQVIKNRLEADNQAKQLAEEKRQERVKAQREALAERVSSAERDTGPIQQIASPKFRKLGNAEKVAQALDKYGEPYIRQNIDTISAEIGMHKSTIYAHLKTLKQA